MAKNFHEQFDREEDLPLPSDRSTGLVFTAVALIVAYLWRGNPTVMQAALGIAAALAIVSLAAPKLIRPLNIVWMKFALLLSKVMHPVVMLVLFLVAIVPAGLLMQIGYDPLRKRRTSAKSYWIERKPSAAPSSMKNQF